MSSRLPSSLSARAGSSSRSCRRRQASGSRRPLPPRARADFELDRAAGGLELGLDRDRNREAGGGDLRRRPEEDLGRCRRRRACRRRPRLPEAPPWRRSRSAAGYRRRRRACQDGPIGGKLASRRDGRARPPSCPRRARVRRGSGLRCARSRRRPDRCGPVVGVIVVTRNCPMREVLERPVAPQQLAGQQDPAAGASRRLAPVGTRISARAEAGLGGSAPRRARAASGRSRPEHTAAGKRRGVRPAGPSRRLFDADARPGQQPHLDPALGLGLRRRPLGDAPARCVSR